MMPLVSICIPTFNGSEFLRETLECIENQTYSSIEVIISDDNSKDGTLSIIKDFKNSSRFPVQLYQHVPSGIGANWNNCISKSNGDYIKFLLQDDLLSPQCVETMVDNAIQTNKRIIISKRNIIYDPKSVNKDWLDAWLKNYEDLQYLLDIRSYPFELNRQFFKDPSFIKLPRNKIGEPTTSLVHRTVFEQVGLYREDLKQILDFEFWYRALPHFPILIINEKLVSFRIHSGQATQQNLRKDIYDYHVWDDLIQKEYFKYYNLRQKIRVRGIKNKFFAIFNNLLSHGEDFIKNRIKKS